VILVSYDNYELYTQCPRCLRVSGENFIQVCDEVNDRYLCEFCGGEVSVNFIIVLTSDEVTNANL